MARKTLPLTDTQVKNAKPREREYNLSDGQGLQIRIKPNGTKLWLFNYKHPVTRKRNNLSLGNYPTVTIASARTKREEFKQLLANSIDPKAHREEQSQIRLTAATNNFKAVSESWLEIQRTKLNPVTYKKTESSFVKHVYPEIGKLPVEEITAPKAIKIVNKLTSENKIETAKKVSRRMNNVLTFAVNTGLIHHNPLSGIKEVIPNQVVKNMATIKPSEMPELMETIANANIKTTTRLLTLFQLHTMVRPVEAATAEWDEINLKEKLWIIPASKMKMRKEHKIPLSPPVINILNQLKNISGNRQYLFPADRNPKSHANSSTVNMALKRMGYKGRLVSHGMRALASTTLNDNGFDPEIIEYALAHKDPNKIRAAYNRAEYIEKRREMMNWWSNKIESAASNV